MGQERASAVGSAARFDENQFRMRVAMTLALAVACAWIPAAGDNRLWLAAFLATIVFPAHLVLRRVTGVPNPTGWVDLLAIVAGAMVAAIEPTLWLAAFLLAMLDTAGAVAFLRPVWVMRLATTSFVLMGTVAMTRPVDGAVPALVVATVFVPGLLVGANQKVQRERKSTLRLDAVTDSVPVLVWQADPRTGGLHWVTGRCDELLGVDRRQLQADGFGPWVHPDEVERHRSAREHDSTLRVLEYRFVRPDGTHRWLRDQVEWATTHEGRVLRGVTTDVTDERCHQLGVLQRQQLIDRLDQMTVILESTPDGHVITTATDPFGWLDGGAVDAGAGPFADRLERLAAEPSIVSGLARLPRTGTLRLAPFVVNDPGGHPRHFEVDLCRLPGDVVGMLVDDVTEREHANAQLLHQAHHDDLTGLVNRAVLLADTTARIDRRERVALLLLDLNGFKNVNDTLGHLTGDEVLKIIGERLRWVCPSDATIARLGGDEFAILIPKGQPDEVERVVAAILERCRDAVVIDTVAVVMGASLGVAYAPVHATDAEGLLRCADVAMYAAKRNDQGHRYFTSDLTADRHHLELLGDLRRAFVEGQFELLFQPKVWVATGTIVGAEALVRWRHPTHGLLAPDDFLGLVSMAGYGDEMGDVTMAMAIDAMLVLPAELSVSVNLTANNLRQRDLVSRTVGMAAGAGVDLSRLIVEITESHVIDNTGVIHTTIHEFAEAGARISIDDFGTGYSSMVNLRSLPLDEIKVDRTFVANMASSDQDHAIVRAVIDLAHSLGLAVTAEGVEEPETLARLVQLGCDLSQGYLHGRPMPLDDLGAAIAAQRRSMIEIA